MTVWPGDLLFEVYQMGDVFIVFYCLFCVLLLCLLSIPVGDPQGSIEGWAKQDDEEPRYKSA